MKNLKIKLDTSTRDIVVFYWDKEVSRMWVWIAYWFVVEFQKEDWNIEPFSSNENIWPQ